MEKRRRILFLFVSMAIITGIVLASQDTSQATTKLNFRGTTTLGIQMASDSSANGGSKLEIRQGLNGMVNRLIPFSGLSPARVPADHVPTLESNPVTSINTGFLGFNGISHRDQRLSGTGGYSNTQFSLEPPDQALSVGNGFVLEAVNDALAIYDISGTRLAVPTPLNQFFKLAPAIIRSDPPVYGDFISDPKSYYDPDTDRWFLTVLQMDINSSTGTPSGRTHIEFGVSKTGDPTGDWNLFELDTTDDGKYGTPSHPNCPCLGDQPLIGADANGFYISTNEFSLFSTPFNGAQIYAISKTALAAGQLPTVVHINTGDIATPDIGGIWYSIQPATTLQGNSQATGTEYFLSSLDFTAVNAYPSSLPSGGLDNRIAVWKLTGTDTLAITKPSLSLTHMVIDSEVYGIPPSAQQKNGTLPLAQLLGNPKPKLEFLDSSDVRMQTTIYAAGKLWGALETVMKTQNGPVRAGIAFFIIEPSSGTMFNQGYVAVNQENLLYPAIAVNPKGKGVLSFTLVGQDFFPSAAYASIDAVKGAGDVHIAGAGAKPEDGFTGYAALNPPILGDRVARWGDYSGAAVDESGNIWIATEYIPNAWRTVYANWGTFISQVTP